MVATRTPVFPKVEHTVMICNFIRYLLGPKINYLTVIEKTMLTLLRNTVRLFSPIRIAMMRMLSRSYSSVMVLRESLKVRNTVTRTLKEIQELKLRTELIAMIIMMSLQSRFVTTKKLSTTGPTQNFKIATKLKVILSTKTFVFHSSH